jgi:hypothetical protein
VHGGVVAVTIDVFDVALEYCVNDGSWSYKGCCCIQLSLVS